ncbi:hypothetical protein DFH09DRAFT_1181880 [Mycena vulgaris]|nr:hypothetical protein DFH09DRAFT_1181880 [Mycena vulgaris]
MALPSIVPTRHRLLPSAEGHRETPAGQLMTPYCRPLREVLQSIYSGYRAGDHCALYANIHLEAPERISRYKHLFDVYEVPSIAAPELDMCLRTRRREICARGMSAIKQMLMDVERLEPNVGVNQPAVLFGDVALETQDLKASCKKLCYLLHTGRSSTAVRERIEKLVERIEFSPVMNKDLLQHLDGFTELHSKFWELALAREDTKGTVRELGKLVAEASANAGERVAEFDAIMETYNGSGRKDLATIMRESAKAAKKAGFREGVSSPAESQQIYGELAKVDKSLECIRRRLKDIQDFWQKVDRDLKSAPYTYMPTQGKDPPETRPESVDHQAQKIEVSLESIHHATQQYSHSPRILKDGGNLVRSAFNLTEDCTIISRTQSTIETRLESQPSDSKTCRKALSPLTKGLARIMTGYEKLSLQFRKYAQLVYLLFWFAGTTAAEKLRSTMFIHSVVMGGLNGFVVERPDHVAHAVLLSKGLSSYVVPFESALTSIERHLRGIQKLWMGLELTDWDGIRRVRPLDLYSVKTSL